MNEHLQQQWLAKDRQYIWHPFTQMKDYAERDHILIERAEGAFLYDAAGNRYYDSISSWWVNPHGHSHPHIRAAVNEQLQSFDHVQFSGFTHVPAIRLAERLVQMAPPGLDKVFYSDNGSTAVEVALKMSFQYWQQTGNASKTKFVFLENSYHGDTLGAVSVGGVDLYHALYKPLLFHALKLPAPQVTQLVLNDVATMTEEQQQAVESCLATAEKLFSERHKEIAGIIVEPMIQAAGGINIYPAAYLEGLRRLCDRYEIHLIADEVAVGFARTGKMFACEHAGISPDILCLSKALTGGLLPLSVTMCTSEIYDAFYDDYETYKTFFHGHGYTANAIACAAANASLDIFTEEHTPEHVQTLATELSLQLQTLSELPHITNVRQLGLIAAFQLQPSQTNNNRIGFRTYIEGLQHGIILRPLGDVLYYWLPLCVRPSDIHEIVQRTKAVLETVYGN
jgi:adenosylmethionine-8-amino-7-oxononanoate aminotransferase